MFFTATLKHVAKTVAHVDLSDHIIQVVYTIFDENSELPFLLSVKNATCITKCKKIAILCSSIFFIMCDEIIYLSFCSGWTA